MNHGMLPKHGSLAFYLLTTVTGGEDLTETGEYCMEEAGRHWKISRQPQEDKQTAARR